MLDFNFWQLEVPQVAVIFHTRDFELECVQRRLSRKSSFWNLMIRASSDFSLSSNQPKSHL